LAPGTLFCYPDGVFASTTKGDATEEMAKKLQAAVTYAAAKGADEWACEWRVPWDALGFAPAAKPRILCNLLVRRSKPRGAPAVWQRVGWAWHVERAAELNVER